MKRNHALFLVLMLCGLTAPALAQKHLTRQWSAERGYFFAPCPCEKSGKACACRAWAAGFLQADGSLWGSVSAGSRAQAESDRNALVAFERQYEAQFPHASTFKATNYKHPTIAFCRADAASCAHLPAAYGEEITSEEKDLRLAARTQAVQTQTRALKEWALLVRMTRGRHVAVSAQDGALLAETLLRASRLDALLLDGATPHRKRIREAMNALSGAMEKVAAQEQRLTGGNAAPVHTVALPSDPAHPTEANKDAALNADDRGSALYRQMKYAEAAEAYLQAARLDGTNPTLQKHLGLLLEEQSKFAEEEADFRELAKRVPNLPHAHFWLGKALCKENKFAEAESELRQCVRFDPKIWFYHYFLAVSLRGEGKTEEANHERKIADDIRRKQPLETP